VTSSSAWAEVGRLVTGTPPSRIGIGSGPLTAWRRRKHRRRYERDGRAVRICLLEAHTDGVRFGADHAFWINQRSRRCVAAVNASPRTADVIWVFSQDPLEPAVRARLEAALDGVPATTPVLNRPEHYDAYHRDDAFPRLAAAGVSVPRHRFGPEDVGRTEVVYKRQGGQGAEKFSAPYRGELPGYRAFGREDGRGPDGLVRRYRAWYLAGDSHPEQVILSAGWNACLASLVGVERTFEMTGEEREQVARIGAALQLDFFAVDYLRRREDGRPVFLDVNVYPTMTEAYTAGLAGTGTWHLWDAGRRAGLPPPHGRDPWAVLDDAVTRLVGRGRVGSRTPGDVTVNSSGDPG
jgi:hypothetical protein